jgi:hypothetical protein
MLVPLILPLETEEPGTDVWGPPLWKVLHVLANVNDLGRWRTLLDLLRTALPCPECSAHFNAWLDAHPLIDGTKMDLWLLALHNDINRREGTLCWNEEQLRSAYAGRVVTDADIAPVRTLIGPVIAEAITEAVRGFL